MAVGTIMRHEEKMTSEHIAKGGVELREAIVDIVSERNTGGSKGCNIGRRVTGIQENRKCKER